MNGLTVIDKYRQFLKNKILQQTTIWEAVEFFYVYFGPEIEKHLTTLINENSSKLRSAPENTNRM